MIVSHRWRFIFIKTTKTASTSVELALSGHLGPDDAMGAIQEHPGQNHFASLRDYSPKDLAKLVIRRRRKAWLMNHSPGALVRDRLPAAWNDYFKFAVERNPWDRAISLYYWKNRTEKRPGSLHDFLVKDFEALNHLKRTGWGLYTIDGKVAVDRILRYESLDSEFALVCETLGLPLSTLPRAKGTLRTDRRDYREVMCHEAQTRVASVFADEIALMGYAS